MKLKNIESIEELKVGDVIYIRTAPQAYYREIKLILQDLIAYKEDGGEVEWICFKDLQSYYQIEDKSSEWVPKQWDRVWRVDFGFEDNVRESIFFEENTIDNSGFQQGVIFQTKEEAIACAKKMLEAIKK